MGLTQGESFEPVRKKRRCVLDIRKYLEHRKILRNIKYPFKTQPTKLLPSSIPSLPAGADLELAQALHSLVYCWNNFYACISMFPSLRENRV